MQTESTESQTRRKCIATTRAGNPCTNHPQRDKDVCISHDPAWRGHREDIRRKAQEAAARRKNERRATRGMTALDWAARKLEEKGEHLAQLIIDAAERGDWRAAAFLYERVHGKPMQSVKVGELDAENLRELSDEELHARLRHLRAVRTPPVPQGGDDQETSGLAA